MQQTPLHEHHNPDLLSLIPIHSSNLVEIGCSSGALAREYKRINPTCNYLGIEISNDYASSASRYCDAVVTMDIENTDEEFFSKNSIRDCWIFGDTLEHLKDPWRVLGNIRRYIPSNGFVVACIPNAQHWSVQVKLCVGDFRYENTGLLDRTHLRWFTRQTILELFASTGYSIVEARGRVFDEPLRQKYLPIIEALAETAGADPEVAVNDSIPLQYIVKATPTC